jgi:hypothetical protein
MDEQEDQTCPAIGGIVVVMIQTGAYERMDGAQTVAL